MKIVKIVAYQRCVISSESVFGITGPVCEARPRARFSQKSRGSSLHYTQHTSIYTCLMSQKRMNNFGDRLKHCNENYALAFHRLCSVLCVRNRGNTEWRHPLESRNEDGTAPASRGGAAGGGGPPPWQRRPGGSWGSHTRGSPSST